MLSGKERRTLTSYRTRLRKRPPIVEGELGYRLSILRLRHQRMLRGGAPLSLGFRGRKRAHTTLPFLGMLGFERLKLQTTASDRIAPTGPQSRTSQDWRLQQAWASKRLLLVSLSAILLHRGAHSAMGRVGLSPDGPDISIRCRATVSFSFFRLTVFDNHDQSAQLY
jgi:hypothetical protein